MGRCEYVLAKDSMDKSFEVRQVNEACGNRKVSCTKSVSVIFPEMIINLERGSVMVNGTTVTLPANYGGNIYLCLVHDHLGFLWRAIVLKITWVTLLIS